MELEDLLSLPIVVFEGSNGYSRLDNGLGSLGLEDDHEIAEYIQKFVLQRFSKGIPTNGRCSPSVRVTPLFSSPEGLEADHDRKYDRDRKCDVFEVNVRWQQCSPPYRPFGLDRRIFRANLMSPMAAREIALLIDTVLLAYQGAVIVERIDLSHE